MTERRTWFITGAGRGTRNDLAEAAIAAGHNVVATGRNPHRVAELSRSPTRDDATAGVL
jgi:NAD(P)-dependent dehydrogenase (short-subunit alcohol dehydrogenase family)